MPTTWTQYESKTQISWLIGLEEVDLLERAAIAATMQHKQQRQVKQEVRWQKPKSRNGSKERKVKDTHELTQESPLPMGLIVLVVRLVRWTVPSPGNIDVLSKQKLHMALVGLSLRERCHI